MRMGPAEMLFDRNTTRIVLDTSYLIQMFDEVVKAVRTRTWQFIIPHAVLTEVRGLAESDRRGREASQVVAFLESVFDDPASEDADLKLRGVLRIETMQGSAVMNTRLGVEARGGHGETFNGVAVRSSDDRILQTCLRKMLEQMASPGYMPGLPPAVVLVTRDINMRLKARAMGIPVVAGLQNVRDALPA
nr:hypothetical protein HK105_002116 [Polyrhizophydium stewartii]